MPLRRRRRACSAACTAIERPGAASTWTSERFASAGSTPQELLTAIKQRAEEEARAEDGRRYGGRRRRHAHAQRRGAGDHAHSAADTSPNADRRKPIAQTQTPQRRRLATNPHYTLPRVPSVQRGSAMQRKPPLSQAIDRYHSGWFDLKPPARRRARQGTCVPPRPPRVRAGRSRCNRNDSPRTRRA